MNNALRKYISPVLAVSSLLVFLLFVLLSVYITPYTALTNILQSTKLFGDIFHAVPLVGVLGKSFLYLLYTLLLSAPVIALFVYSIIRNKKENKETNSTYKYNRFYNLVSIINNYFFIMAMHSFTSVPSERKVIAVIYIVIFVLTTLINITELLLTNGFLDRLLPIRDNTDLLGVNETKELAKVAKVERIEKTFSTFYFYLIFTTLLALLFFIFPLVTEMFTIPLGGDYTQQQIPFYTNGYDDWWNFIKTGEFPLWDSNTFLGVNNIGSNSFYYSMNPFFLPILLFPRDAIPQGIAVLMIAKFVLAAVTMRMYLKYMGVNEKKARLFSIIYAFAGWNSYYLWFNHFMEVAVVFPLVFLGIEKLLKEKKTLMLILALGLMGFANYFFLMTVLVIGVLYAGFRYFQLLPKSDPSLIGLGIIAFALGTLLSSVVLFPSLLISLNSDRAVNATYLDNLKAAFTKGNIEELWRIITKWEYQGSSLSYKKYFPLITYFFPVLSNRSSALLNTSNYDNTISSLYSFSLVIMLLPPAIYNSFKKRKYSHFIALAFLILALFTPFFYNAFHGFTKEYGRWQLIVPFALITYVATSYEEIKEMPPVVFDVSLVINLVLMGFTVAIAYSYENRNGFGLMNEREFIIFYQFIMIFLTYVSLRLFNKSKYEDYYKNIILVIEIAVMGTATMVGHGFISYRRDVSGGLQNYNNDYEVIRKIDNLDDSFYRIYNTNAIRGNDNLPMRENYDGLSAFHSLYNFELMDFLNYSKVSYNNNGWSLGVFERRTFLYDFLQVKYYVLDENDHVINWSNGTKSLAPYKNVPNHYSFQEDLSSDVRFVYKVDDTFDLGFGVDYAITTKYGDDPDNYDDYIIDSGVYSPVQNEELYLNAAILSPEDLKEVEEEASHLGSETYQTINRKSYTRFTNTSGLKVQYLTMINPSTARYPYEAQIAGGTILPTPEWVSNNAIVSTSSTTLPALLDGSKHVIEYTKSDGTNIIGEGGGEIILNIPLAYSSSAPYNFRYRVFLYDENYELITFDDHSVLPSSSRYWKAMRAYHSPVAVKKIALVPYGSSVTKLSSHDAYIYPQNVIDSVRQNSITNSLTNVVVHTNSYNFTTDFTNKKFVVTTVPFDPGWKVTTSEGEKSVYKVQGGFVGFVSDVGETDYVMSFKPTTFNIGLMLSVVSLAITLLLELNVHYYKLYKKKKAQSELESNSLTS